MNTGSFKRMQNLFKTRDNNKFYHKIDVLGNGADALGNISVCCKKHLQFEMVFKVNSMDLMQFNGCLGKTEKNMDFSDNFVLLFI